MLVPAALDRAIQRAVVERSARLGVDVPDVPAAADLLNRTTATLRDQVQAQLIARRIDFLRNTGVDPAQLTRGTLASFNPLWDTLESRLSLVPGKIVLRSLRDILQRDFGVVLTDSKIIDAIHRYEFPEDMQTLIRVLDEFRRREP